MEFWSAFLAETDKSILFVLARGFDPRMCTGLETLLQFKKSRITCLLVEFEDGKPTTNDSLEKMATQNHERLLAMCDINTIPLQPHKVNMWGSVGSGRHRVGARNAAALFDIGMLAPYTDVIVDISSMPRSIYVALIGKLMFIIDQYSATNPTSRGPNLHVMVTEDSDLDHHIRDRASDETPNYVHGFSSGMEEEATANMPKIWFPILSENRRNQAEKIYAHINPAEVCPILPSPSIDPRRGDSVFIALRDLLFDEWRIEPRNIIYSSEQNPFETYRQIYKAIIHYNVALKPLGGCKSILSVLSSKLLSIGALLAAYELRKDRYSVGITHLETQEYNLEGAAALASITNEQLHTLWLMGSCYEL